MTARGRRAEYQWKQAQPQTVEGLKKEGVFYQMLVKTQRRARLVFDQARRNGASYEQAEEFAMQEMFLPAGQTMLGQWQPDKTSVVS